MTDARTSPVATSASNAAVTFHDALAASWEGKYQKESFGRRAQLLSEMLRGVELAGTTWLDAGCGTGTLSRWLADKHARVFAVDASAEMVRVASAVPDSSAGIEYRTVQTIANLPSADATFDGALCSSVLEYVPDPAACMTEFRRVLKPGGVLMVSVPNSRSLVRKLLQFGHWSSKVVGRSWMPYLDHSRHEYSSAAFATMLVNAGFDNIRSVPFGAGLPDAIGTTSWAGPLLMFRAHRIGRI
jgi:2-polyprenyl-3-methyl-5-hydroxy-6-metoxy-1,4-benzoquinol methylase